MRDRGTYQNHYSVARLFRIYKKGGCMAILFLAHWVWLHIGTQYAVAAGPTCVLNIAKLFVADGHTGGPGIVL